MYICNIYYWAIYARFILNRPFFPGTYNNPQQFGDIFVACSPWNHPSTSSGPWGPGNRASNCRRPNFWWADFQMGKSGAVKDMGFKNSPKDGLQKQQKLHLKKKTWYPSLLFASNTYNSTNQWFVLLYCSGGASCTGRIGFGSCLQCLEWVWLGFLSCLMVLLFCSFTIASESRYLLRRGLHQ